MGFYEEASLREAHVCHWALTVSRRNAMRALLHSGASECIGDAITNPAILKNQHYECRHVTETRQFQTGSYELLLQPD